MAALLYVYMCGEKKCSTKIRTKINTEKCAASLFLGIWVGHKWLWGKLSGFSSGRYHVIGSPLTSRRRVVERLCGLSNRSVQVEMLRRGRVVLVGLHRVVDGLDGGGRVHVLAAGAQLQEGLVHGGPEVAEEEGGHQEDAQAHAAHDDGHEEEEDGGADAHDDEDDDDDHLHDQVGQHEAALLRAHADRHDEREQQVQRREGSLRRQSHVHVLLGNGAHLRRGDLKQKQPHMYKFTN